MKLLAKAPRRWTLDFLKTEAAAGAILGLAALAALVVANSPLAETYFHILKGYQVLQIGPLRLELTVSDWIKEGLMALFFLVVGLEIKYEILRGELSDPKKLVSPVMAALGGMVAPAVIYVGLAVWLDGPLQGWPIPLATDIAFALAVFAMVGRGLPSSLRVFLLTLAIVDDLGAIALIAALFSSGVAWMPIALAAALLVAGGVWARDHAVPAPFWILGFGLIWWLSVVGGLSTSLIAVAFAVIVPIDPRKEDCQSPLREAMRDLHPYVAYCVLPIFAFAKAGVSFTGIGIDQVMAPLVIGIAMGLFFGKQLGVFGFAWLATRLGWGSLPNQSSWAQLYGVSLLCGVGFTMSLFIGALAFPGAVDSPEQIEVKLGVLLGSLLSAVLGAAVLAFAKRGVVIEAEDDDDDPVR